MTPVDEFITQSINVYKEIKLRTFFDELETGNIEITKELIEDQDFLHAYFSTVNAVIRTRTEHKIKLFANALKRYACSNIKENADEYQELVNILLEMSDMEIDILKALDSFESANNGYNHKSIYKKSQLVESFWPQFEEEISRIIPVNQVMSRLTRLQRSGLYEKFGNMIIDDNGDITPGHAGSEGFLTSLYYKLKEYTSK